jgi:predicted RND superfamily exporter protein
MSKLEKRLGAIALAAHRRPIVGLGMAAVLTAIGAVLSAQLPVVADLEKLLPQTFRSVQDLEPVKERFGGIGHIIFVGMDAEPDQLKAWAEEMAPRVQAEIEGIRYVEYKPAGNFFKEHGLYYFQLDDLKEMQGRIKGYEKCRRRKANPMLVKFDEEEQADCVVPNMDDLIAKQGMRSDQRLAKAGQDYYLDPDKKIVFLMAKPVTPATNLAFAAKLVQDSEAFLGKQDNKKWGPKFHTGLTGTYKYKVDQQRQITNDMTNASVLAMIIMLVYLAFHFRSGLAVGLVLAPVFAGLAWTYGITFLVFGKLNILTGFLGAVLGGLGTEHGIHLLTRYSTLRAEGASSEDATREAFEHTGASALVSSLVAALTFAAISFSEFRAFREFGVIAAVGMIVVFTAYFFILPGCLGLAARFGWKPSTKMSGATSEVARLMPRLYKPVALIVGLGVAFFIALMPRITFNYDFHALEDSSLPSFILDREVNRILGYTAEPVVILTNSTETERAAVAEVKRRKAEHGKDSTIDFVSALDDLVPGQQQEKREVLDLMAETLNKSNDPKLADTKKIVDAKPFTRDDIPISLRKMFQGVKDSGGGFVLIFPNIRLSDGLQVLKFSDEVADLKLPTGEAVAAAGEAMVLADVLRMVRREGKPILLGAIIAVILAMWITLGSLKEALICMMPTALSLLALIGLMTLIDQPFNYLNIIIIPVLIGTTVDAGVHLISRLRDAHGNFTPVFAETGRAICGGLVTSGVGFAAMMLADHPGLNSLGRLANLGFAMNLIVMILGFPAFLLLTQKKPSGEPAHETPARPDAH